MLTTSSPEEDYATFNTNVFGMLNVSRAVLPYLRAAAGEKVIANFGSIGSWSGGPGYALYSATKWACSGISESMRPELEPFGIITTVIEPGYFRTNLLNANARIKSAVQMKEYDETGVGETRKMLDNTNNKQLGDVEKGAKVIVDILTHSGVAEGKAIPVRVALGSDATPFIINKCKETEKLLNEWKDITTTTDHAD
jgi:NAD(P)-dependent dehydrogenase (short-subunit alcohol dehydrogenase family)